MDLTAAHAGGSYLGNRSSPGVMGRCPHCEEEVDGPNGQIIKSSEFFNEEAGADVSGQQHVQLECPACERSLGYLAVAAATGGG